MEIWRDIKGYEGIFYISNLGNCKRKFTYSDGRVKYKKLKGYIAVRGYRCYVIRANGLKKTRTVHQLVAEAFLNHEPCGYKLVVDHIDNNPLNNRLDNLQVITHRENTSKDKTGGTSRYIGVSFDSKRNKYIAQCYHNGKNIYLGSFKTEIEASKVYNNFLKSITNK